MAVVRFIAKMDGTCWQCGGVTLMGTDRMVFLTDENIYLHEACFVPEQFSTVEAEPCSAITKQGYSCPIPASKGFTKCHVHEESLQCGATKRGGDKCKIATGGKRCAAHSGVRRRKRKA